jgi:hypothetical protein
MAIPLPTGRRRPRSDADHALDVGALARERAFDSRFSVDRAPRRRLDDRVAKDTGQAARSDLT